jgi:hypothetical protein
MDPVEVLGIEVAQYVGQGQQALVPRTIGRTADAQSKKGMAGPTARTSRETFLSHWEGRGREVYQRLLDFAQEHGLVINWGIKGFSMNVPVNGQKVSLLEGHRPDMYQGNLIYFGGILSKVHDYEPIISFYTEEILKIASATRVSDKSLRCLMWELSDEEEAHLHSTLLAVAERIRRHGLAQSTTS